VHRSAPAAPGDFPAVGAATGADPLPASTAAKHFFCQVLDQDPPQALAVALVERGEICSCSTNAASHLARSKLERKRNACRRALTVRYTGQDRINAPPRLMRS